MTLKHLCDMFGTNSTTKDLNFITILPKSEFNTVWPNRLQRDILSNQVYDSMVLVRIALQFHNKTREIRRDWNHVNDMKQIPKFWARYTVFLFLWVCFMTCWTECKALYTSPVLQQCDWLADFSSNLKYFKCPQGHQTTKTWSKRDNKKEGSVGP